MVFRETDLESVSAEVTNIDHLRWSFIVQFHSLALEFEPGIGGGLGYTDNIRLTSDNQEDELIAVGYVGARLEHDSGPIQADALASLNHVRYTKDTFPDQRYFNLRATADWEMVENRI